MKPSPGFNRIPLFCCSLPGLCQAAAKWKAGLSLIPNKSPTKMPSILGSSQCAQQSSDMGIQHRLLLIIYSPWPQTPRQHVLLKQNLPSTQGVTPLVSFILKLNHPRVALPIKTPFSFRPYICLVTDTHKRVPHWTSELISLNLFNFLKKSEELQMRNNFQGSTRHNNF